MPTKHLALERLFDKELKALQFIEAYYDEHHYPPTWEEVGYVLFGKKNAFGPVQWVIKRLEQRGLVKYDKRAYRSTLVVHPYSEIQPYLVKHLGYTFLVGFPPFDEIMRAERERVQARSDLEWVDMMKKRIQVERELDELQKSLDARPNE